MPPKGNNQDRKAAYIKAILTQKLDTVRWSILHGGQDVTTRDDESRTALMICSARNLTKSLVVMLDVIQRRREKEPLDLVDDEGRTALMMASANGYRETVRELLNAGANHTIKDEKGLTAGAYAKKRGHDDLARYIERGGESSDEEEEEDEVIEAGMEEMTSTQRSKLRKQALLAKENRGAVDKKKGAAEEEEEEEEEAGPLDARWEEVGKVHAAGGRELIIERQGEAAPDGAEVVDPAVWACKTVNSLKLVLGATLVALPEGIARLKALSTLVLSDNALETLPDAIGSLTHLKVFEAEGNKLSCLPEAFGKLASLETLRLRDNELVDVSALAPLGNLVTLNLDGNKLDSLEDIDLGEKERLVSLSVSGNEIEEIPEEIGQLQLLAEIFFSNNRIEELPGTLGDLKEKKVRCIELQGNPISDPKVKKMMGKSATFVKELLTYIRKNGNKKGKGGKGKKNKKKKVESSDEEEDADDEYEIVEASDAAGDAAAAEAAAAAVAEAKVKEEEEKAAAEAAEAAKGGGKKLSKKEQQKLARKQAEEESKARAAAAAAKQLEKIEKTKEVLASLPDADDDAPAPGGYAYSLDPKERDRLLKEEAKKEAERLRIKEEEARAEEAKLRRQAEELEQRTAQLSLSKDQKMSEDSYIWVFAGGGFQKKHVDPSEIPKLVGRIIGKGGENIRMIETRSTAKVRVNQEAKASQGMTVVVVVGTHASIESARMLINQCFAGGRK